MLLQGLDADNSMPECTAQMVGLGLQRLPYDLLDFNIECGWQEYHGYVSS